MFKYFLFQIGMKIFSFWLPVLMIPLVFFSKLLISISNYKVIVKTIKIFDIF
jgi:hypothetical protein